MTLYAPPGTTADGCLAAARGYRATADRIDQDARSKIKSLSAGFRRAADRWDELARAIEREERKEAA